MAWTRDKRCRDCRNFDKKDGTCNRYPPTVFVAGWKPLIYRFETRHPEREPNSPRCGEFEQAPAA